MSVRTFRDSRSIHMAAVPAGDREDSSTSEDEVESLAAFATLDEHELEFLRFISSDPAYPYARSEFGGDRTIQTSARRREGGILKRHQACAFFLSKAEARREASAQMFVKGSDERRAAFKKACP